MFEFMPRIHRNERSSVVGTFLTLAGIMMAHALTDAAEKDNLIGDIPALFLVAFVLWFLMPASSPEQM